MLTTGRASSPVLVCAQKNGDAFGALFTSVLDLCRMFARFGNAWILGVVPEEVLCTGFVDTTDRLV